MWWYPRVTSALDHLGKQFIGVALTATDACWACEERFSQNLTHHDHHIIPRAFGGDKGPQVRICSPHHQLLHALADTLVANGRVRLDDLNPSTAERVLFLATRVALAEIRTGDQPTKRVLTSFYLTAADNNALLARLARTRPKTTKQALMELLVRQFLNS